MKATGHRGAVTSRALLLVCVALAGFAPTPAAGQDDGPEVLAQMALAQLREGIKQYDLDAIEEAIVDLDSVYTKVSPKTLKKIVKGYTSVLSLEVRHEERWEGATPEDDLQTSYQLTIGVLYDKPEGGAVLIGALKQRHVKDWPEVQALILEGLGYRVEDENVKLFSSYLDHELPGVVVAAAGALGQYAEADPKVRKAAAKALIDAFVAHGRAADKEQKKGKSEEAQDYLVLVEGAFNDSLGKLTRERFGDPGSWAEWFADHGAADW